MNMLFEALDHPVAYVAMLAQGVEYLVSMIKKQDRPDQRETMPSHICSALINVRYALVSLWSICFSQQRVHFVSSGRYKLTHACAFICLFVMLNIVVPSCCPDPYFLDMVWNLL
jgi:hypothetical protein